MKLRPWRRNSKTEGMLVNLHQEVKGRNPQTSGRLRNTLITLGRHGDNSLEI